MDKEFKNFLKGLFREQSRSTVGRLCKRLEMLQTEDLAEDQKLNILKSYIKETVYEQFRDLRNNIIFYSEGRSYTKFPIYSPTKDNKKS